MPTLAKSTTTKAVYQLMSTHMFQNVGIPLLLKDTAIMDVYIKFPMICYAVDLQRGVFGVLSQEAKLLVELFLNSLG